MYKVKFSTPVLLIIAVLPLLFLIVTARADLLGDDDVLWKSGINLYIKFDKQDKSAGGKTPPNQHPVNLSTQEIAAALKSVEFWSKKGFFSREKEVNTVFSTSQAQLLGTYLSQGLKKAKPDQDIVFALASIKSGGLLKEKYYMAGRAFYQDNRLNIIIGDYDRPPDKGLEAATGATGTTEVQYFFTLGRRAKSSSMFKKPVRVGDGIEVHEAGGKKPRQDWLVIDVPVAAAAYTAALNKKDQSGGGADAAAIRAETARLEQERREMRAEMARMRKEMGEAQDNGSSGKSTEERLAELDELHKKKLISDAEYERKRKEILDDI